MPETFSPQESRPVPEETYYPNQPSPSQPTTTVPKQPNAFQIIKDRLKPLGTKAARLFRRDASDEPPTAAEQPTDPVLQTTPARPHGVATPQAELNGLNSDHADLFDDETDEQPTQVPFAEELDQFDIPDEEPLFDLPEERESTIPQQQPLTLPSDNVDDDVDLFDDEPAETPPSPEPAQPESGPSFEESDEPFDAAMPQLLPAPVSRQPARKARQVKFVPVSTDQFTAFQIPQLAICSEVRSFQDYDELDRGALRKGREILIYNTLRNFVSERSPQGYRTLTRATVELLGHGDRVVHRRSLGEAPDASRSLRRDYFITHRYVVPKDVPAGMYTLRLRIEDVLGHQAAHSSMTVHVAD